MVIRYKVERKLGTDAWTSCDLRSGHVSFAYVRRLAQTIKKDHPEWKVRVVGEMHVMHEFVVEEV